jgi:hypothetical protein
MVITGVAIPVSEVIVPVLEAGWGVFHEEIHPLTIQIAITVTSKTDGLNNPVFTMYTI